MLRALALALALVPFLTGAAEGQQRTPLRFKVSVWPDDVLVGGALALALVPIVWPNSFAKATCAPCNPANLWSVDRSFVGPLRTVPDKISYLTIGAEAALGTVFLAKSRRGEGSAAFWEDFTVISQSFSATAAVGEWAKVLFHRPRPFRYLSTATGPATADEGRSFPGGHTSLAFAMAASYASVLHRRGLLGSHKVQVGALFALAAATSVLRNVAHDHFPTDSFAGAVLGFGIGWFLPQLHATIH